MKVTLIKYDKDAVEQLLFSKSTRLTLSPSLMQEIHDWPHEKKMAELQYMANTIPSSWEFTDYTFLMEDVSRAYTHQQVRTRVASFAQQTMRVLNMGDFGYVYPDKAFEDPEGKAILDSCLQGIKSTYGQLIERGWAPEDARGVLPTNIATNILCKFTLRGLSELTKSRSGGRTQKEYQRVVNGMIDAVLEVHPWAHMFLTPAGRDYFAEIEAFAEAEYGGDLLKKGRLLKIVDLMRKEKK